MGLPPFSHAWEKGPGDVELCSSHGVGLSIIFISSGKTLRYGDLNAHTQGTAMTQDELLALIDEAAKDGRKKLDLSGQGLTALPPEIGKLTQLEVLKLGKRNKKSTWEGYLFKAGRKSLKKGV